MIRCTEKVIPLNNCGNILPFGVGNVAGGEREGEISWAGCQREGEISWVGCQREGEISWAGCQRKGENFLGWVSEGGGDFSVSCMQEK